MDQRAIDGLRAQIDELRKRAAWYEELRQATDGGSESMTHEDAVEHVKGLQQDFNEYRRLHCACVFVDEVNTEQCKLHGAWCNTLHEQADYRRERDALKDDLLEMRQQREKLCDAIDAHKQDWSRFHHVMKNHGLHPGRTDDDLIDILDSRLDALAAENKVLREDAARYRWLRHGDNDEVILVPCTWTTTGYLPRNEELDAAIDAALTKEATNG